MSGNVEGVEIVIAGLEAWASGLIENATAAMLEIADVLEAYAKANHPWQNETGDTEASIKGQISDISKEMIVVTLSAGMDYDQFLELAHGGQWAWLWPAVIENQDKIRAILKKWMGNASVRRYR